MSRKHKDGSAKGDCHIAQVLIPKAEHEAQVLMARRLGLPFSTYARVAMRIVSEPEHRRKLLDEHERVQKEQRGEVEPRFAQPTRIP